MPEYDSLIYFSILAINIVYGLWHLNKMARPYKIFILLLSITLFSEILAEILAHTIANNCMVYHIFAPVHFILISSIYYQLSINKSSLRYFTVFSTALIIIFSILNSVFLQPINIFPSNIILANSIFFLAYTLLTYNQMLQKPSTIPLLKQSIFWFNTANIIYISITFFYWAFYNLKSINFDMPDIIRTSIIFITILVYLMNGLAIYFSVSKNKTAHG